MVKCLSFSLSRTLGRMPVGCGRRLASELTFLAAQLIFMKRRVHREDNTAERRRMKLLPADLLEGSLPFTFWGLHVIGRSVQRHGWKAEKREETHVLVSLFRTFARVGRTPNLPLFGILARKRFRFLRVKGLNKPPGRTFPVLRYGLLTAAPRCFCLVMGSPVPLTEHVRAPM